ncbi:MAG: T9SS type A sorting domain-containing protein [Chlorobi bacterium]|nr:T9SS type A sorting domain-containing protein [Chlorobiota bacterium]
MIKSTIILSLSFFIFSSSFSQVQKTEPINESFLNFYTSLKTGNLSNNYGYIPAPVKAHFSTNKLKQTYDLPATYDLRDSNWVSSVKDQLRCGSCWNFTSLAVLESCWMHMGLPEYDLSEQNMRTCQQFSLPGTGTCNFGNELVASSYFFSRLGPVSEQNDSYNSNSWAECDEGLPSIAYVPEARYLPDDKDIIKQSILKYGGVYASMYMEDGNPDYFETSSSYYYRFGSEVNHAVLLVGWNDNKRIFYKTGAWLAKNSWGTDWGADGYFYISYYDKKVLTSSAIFPTKLPADKYANIYMYDELGWLSNTGFQSDTAYGLTKFTASGKQKITDVGTYVNASNTTLQIKIYLGKTGNKLYGLVSELNNLECEFPGHYVFPLTDTIKVLEGNTFYVEVKYKTPGYNYPIPSEKLIEKDGEVFADPQIERNVSWISAEEIYWFAMGNDQSDSVRQVDLTIKAYGIADTTIISPEKTLFINPTLINGYIILDLQNINPEDIILELIDLNGELVYKKKFSNTQTMFSHQINVNSLYPGMYFLRFTNGNDVVSKKIVISGF